MQVVDVDAVVDVAHIWDVVVDVAVVAITAVACKLLSL